MRRVAILLVASLALGTGLVTAASPAFAAKKKTAKITSCKADKNLNVNVQQAFIPFFTGQTAAERVANVLDGTKILAPVEVSTAAARASGQSSAATVTIPVKVVATCAGKTGARFTYDLALNQPASAVSSPPATGAGLNFAGDAVLVKGKWLIDPLTVCDLIGRNPSTPTVGPDCIKAASS
ncbi:MAG: hypothetical protein FJW77_12000 [Actinobacteria bacterium]|nr:hypothetical protein [Actinomycetota bacterium]